MTTYLPPVSQRAGGARTSVRAAAQHARLVEAGPPLHAGWVLPGAAAAAVLSAVLVPLHAPASVVLGVVGLLLLAVHRQDRRDAWRFEPEPQAGAVVTIRRVPQPAGDVAPSRRSAVPLQSGAPLTGRVLTGPSRAAVPLQSGPVVTGPPLAGSAITAPARIVPPQARVVPRQALPSPIVPSQAGPSRVVASQAVPSPVVPPQALPSRVVPPQAVPSRSPQSQPQSLSPADTVPAPRRPHVLERVHRRRRSTAGGASSGRGPS